MVQHIMRFISVGTYEEWINHSQPFRGRSLTRAAMANTIQSAEVRDALAHAIYRQLGQNASGSLETKRRRMNLIKTFLRDLMYHANFSINI